MTVHNAAKVRTYPSIASEKGVERCMKRGGSGLSQRWRAPKPAPLFTFSRVSGGEGVFCFGGAR
jgi:hypothetical protein